MVVLRVAGQVLLVLATLVCLASMGGAMLFAWPALVPLHWLSARRAGPGGAAFWAVLAGLSCYEAGWMSAYAAGAGMASLAVGVVAAVATTTGFLWRRASLVPALS